MACSFYINEAAAIVPWISHCSTGRSQCLMKVAASVVLLGGQFLCNCTDTSDTQERDILCSRKTAGVKFRLVSGSGHVSG